MGDLKYKRYGRVIGINPEDADEYIRYHNEIWPVINEILQKSGVRNYSIFIKSDLLFSYFEMPEDLSMDCFIHLWDTKEGQAWGQIMSGFQKPAFNGQYGFTWIEMDEIFHIE